MHAPADRLDFAPPPQPGMLRAFGLAVFAHLLLVGALMHGLQWKRDTQDAVAEAELWSRVPQQAAPREVVQPPPPPPPPPAPVVQAPPPPPVVKAPPQPEPPVQRQPDIALEREKQKRELERRELEREKQAELAREREQRRRQEAQKKQREEEAARRKEEQARLVAEAKRKEEADRKRKQEQEARETKRIAQQREENMRRIQGMAGTGAPDSKGTAAQSSGPSSSWGARVQARVKPNIAFRDDGPGNPEAVIEVRLAPDGTIVSRRVKKASGNKAWDDAVLRALDRTEVLPRDTDGRVPPSGDLVFRPKG
jgi:colicin import membrane protein